MPKIALVKVKLFCVLKPCSYHQKPGPKAQSSPVVTHSLNSGGYQRQNTFPGCERFSEQRGQSRHTQAPWVSQMSSSVYFFPKISAYGIMVLVFSCALVLWDSLSQNQAVVGGNGDTSVTWTLRLIAETAASPMAGIPLDSARNCWDTLECSVEICPCLSGMFRCWQWDFGSSLAPGWEWKVWKGNLASEFPGCAFGVSLVMGNSRISALELGIGLAGGDVFGSEV